MTSTLSIDPPSGLQKDSPGRADFRKDRCQRNAVEAGRLRIKDNNGLKEFNILALFGPLGIPSTVLGGTLIPNLNSLGATRGLYAHNSAKAVVSVPDPEDEFNRVTTILADLAALDSWFLLCRRLIR
jgi:hypothetical protein